MLRAEKLLKIKLTKSAYDKIGNLHSKYKNQKET